jgi:CelD/BcsL family acetyltransferase involved in cellulose biosynthesis
LWMAARLSAFAHALVQPPMPISSSRMQSSSFARAISQWSSNVLLFVCAV